MASEARNDGAASRHGGDHVEEDEELAAAARAQFRDGRFDGVEIDSALRGVLREGEGVVATSDGSVTYNGVGDPRQAEGRLAVTTDRLIAVGPPVLTISPLEDMEDVIVATGQLHVTVTDGSGFTIETPYPRLLRVQLAEARARRGDDQTGRPVDPAPEDSRR